MTGAYILNVAIGLCGAALAVKCALAAWVMHAPSAGPFRRGLNAAGGVLAALMVWSAFAAAGGPVVVDMRFAQLSSKPGERVFFVTGTKVRDCIRLGNSAQVRDLFGLPDKARLDFLQDPMPGSSRPLGHQAFGRWLIAYDPEFPAVEWLSSSTHWCPPAWHTTETIIGPIPFH